MQCSSLLTCFLLQENLSNVNDLVWIICGVDWNMVNLHVAKQTSTSIQVDFAFELI